MVSRKWILCGMIASVAAVVLNAPAAFSQVRYNVIDLGTLGGAQSKAYGINSRGQIVGEAETSPGQRSAFVWKNGQMTALAAPTEGKTVVARDISDTGIIVGDILDWGSFQIHAAKWSDPTTCTDLNVLPGGNSSSAYGVNDAGVVVGWSSTSASAGRAFKYDSAMTDIGITASFMSSADAINNAGDIAVNFWNTDLSSRPHPGHPHPKAFMSAFVPAAGSWSVPGSVGGKSVIGVWGLNHNGHMVGSVGTTINSYTFAREAPTSGTAIQQTVSATGMATALNDRDVSVGSFYDSPSGTYNAWVCGGLIPGAAENLNGLIAPESGWQLEFAQDVNNLGQIVGYGLYMGVGSPRAFLLDPISGGTSQWNPRLPDTVDGQVKSFADCISGSWVDPEIAEQYDFATTDGSEFTGIIGFPEGFEPLTLEVHGETFTGLGPGSELDFVDLFGEGVSEFSVKGIVSTGADAFSLQLTFDTLEADFEMTAIPEPATMALMFAGLGALVIRRRR